MVATARPAVAAVDQPPGDHRGDEGVAVGGHACCRGQLLGRDVLLEEAARPGLESVVDVLVEIERGQDDDL
jgi:hypothetical protein